MHRRYFNFSVDVVVSKLKEYLEARADDPASSTSSQTETWVNEHLSLVSQQQEEGDGNLNAPVCGSDVALSTVANPAPGISPGFGTSERSIESTVYENLEMCWRTNVFFQ